MSLQTVCLAAILAAALTTPSSAKETVKETLHGQASVIDGDTLEMRGQRIRLFGVDALEGRQLCRRDGKDWRCGQAGANALDRWIAGRNVSCQVSGTDRYQRKIARCFVAADDMQAWLVSNGWALAYRQYSTQYVPFEDQARRAGRGVWTSEFENPADWRKHK